MDDDKPPKGFYENAHATIRADAWEINKALKAAHIAGLPQSTILCAEALHRLVELAHRVREREVKELSEKIENALSHNVGKRLSLDRMGAIVTRAVSVGFEYLDERDEK